MPTILILNHSKYAQTKAVLPGYLGFGSLCVQREYSSDICTFTEVPIITSTSADNKSEKIWKQLCLLSQAEQNGRKKSLSSKLLPLMLCVI